PAKTISTPQKGWPMSHAAATSAGTAISTRSMRAVITGTSAAARTAAPSQASAGGTRPERRRRASASTSGRDAEQALEARREVVALAVDNGAEHAAAGLLQRAL